jgi:hypothetical protein
LFILSLNHKIVTHKADGKFSRYFINSRSYSPDEQEAISIVRREGMRKVLNLLVDSPGLSIRELSTSLDAQESAIGRNVRELLQKGIVAKTTNSGGSPAYVISEKQKDTIEAALERVKR